MATTDENNRYRVGADGKLYRYGARFYTNRDLYRGEFVDNLRHGKGVLMFASGDRYEGDFEYNVFHGIGIYTWYSFTNEFGELVCGRRYEGDFQRGTRHGRGAFFLGNGDSYVGEFVKGQYSGHGTFRNAAGDIYEGEWGIGKPNGKIVLKFGNGDIFDGEMVLGMYQGKGKFTWAPEMGMGYYEGEWMRGKYHGSGTRVYSNDTKYMGKFSEGEIHGEGTMIYANGDQYIGQWYRGKMSGKGVYRYRRGESYEGLFLDGVFYREGKFNYKDGGYYVGEYRNLKINKKTDAKLPLCDGKRHGFGLRVWSNGNQYQGEWHEDCMHGKGTLTTVLGAKYEGPFFNGQKHGRGREEFGNLLGVKYQCPMGNWHSGAGYCVYTGDFNRGFFHGKGRFSCLDGRWYDGEWCFHKRTGQGDHQYLKDGEEGLPNRLFIGGVDSMYRVRTHRGTWVEGVRDGVGLQTFVTGDSIEGLFIKGQPHGIVVYKFYFRKNRPNTSAAVGGESSGGDENIIEHNGVLVDTRSSGFGGKKLMKSWSSSAGDTGDNRGEDGGGAQDESKSPLSRGGSPKISTLRKKALMMVKSREIEDDEVREERRRKRREKMKEIEQYERYALYDMGYRVRWLEKEEVAVNDIRHIIAWRVRYTKSKVTSTSVTASATMAAFATTRVQPAPLK